MVQSTGVRDISLAKVFHREVYIRIALFLQAPQVVRAAWTCTDLRSLFLGSEVSDPGCRLLWRSLCRWRWQNKPRFAIGESRYEGQLVLERRPSHSGLAVRRLQTPLAAEEAAERNGAIDETYRDEVLSELSTPLREMSAGTSALLRITADTTWREAYAKAEADAKRRFIRRAELSSLTWLFNFSRAAGGRGAASMQEVSFEDAATHEDPDANNSTGRLHMELGYPPLPFRLETKLECARCGQTSCTLSCSRCKLVMYCSRACQRVHWKEHTEQCNPFAIVTDAATVPNPAQRLNIADFPPHIVSRVTRTWEWRIHNNNVSLLSAKPSSQGKFDLESAVAKRLLYVRDADEEDNHDGMQRTGES